MHPLKHFTLFVLLMIVTTIAAACGGGDEETPPQPSPIPENLSLPTNTPLATNTPVATQRPLPTVPPRATLPPTWTPGPTEDTGTTDTQDQAQTVATDIPTVPPPELVPGCNGFGPDFDTMTTEFTVGETPTLAWRNVPEAALYRVRVFNEFEFELKIDFTEETSIQIQQDVFTEPGRYSWEVEPLDAIGEQICPTRGEGLRVVAP